MRMSGPCLEALNDYVSARLFVGAVVTGTAADQSSVRVNSASVGSGPKLAPAAIVGIVVVRA